MKLSKPTKELTIKLKQEFLKKDKDSLKKVFDELKENFDFNWVITKDYQLIVLKAEKVMILQEVYSVIIPFFKKRKYNIDIYLSFNMILEVEDERAFEFVTSFLKEPSTDEEIVGCELKFLYLYQNNYFMIIMSVMDVNRVTLDISDIIKDNENLEKKYTNAIAAIQKAIKY